MKVNSNKCHLPLDSGENAHVNIGTSQIKNSRRERLLEIDIYSTLSSENHINQICSKLRAKIKALARLAPVLNKEKKKLQLNAFFKSQLSYSRILNKKINR